MRRGFLLVLTLILLLSTSVPISVRGQDNQLANSRSIAISEAEAAIAEAEEAVAAAAELGGDTEAAQAYLNEARGSLELAIAAGRNGGEDDAILLANEAKELAHFARNLADEERNALLNQRDDEPVAVIDREVVDLEIRERLFYLLEGLEIERREFISILEGFDREVEVGKLAELLRYVGELFHIIRENIAVGRFDLAERGIYNAEIILERVWVGIGEIEKDIRQQADGEIAEHLLLLIEEIDQEKRDLLDKLERIISDVDGFEELRSLIVDVSEILSRVREDIEFHRFGSAEEGIHHARELLGVIRTRLADRVFEVVDVRDDELDRMLHFLQEKLAFFEDLLNEKDENLEDVERAKAILSELRELLGNAILAMENNDKSAVEQIFREAMGLLESLHDFLEPLPGLREVASGSIERYLAEVREAISESRRQLESGRFANPDKAEEVIVKAEELVEQAIVSLSDGRNELAFELLEDAYHLLRRGLGELVRSSIALDTIIARINHIIEKVRSIEKAIADSLDREDSAIVMEVLLEIRTVISQARRAISNGDLEIALKYTEEGELLIQRLLEKISESRDLDQDGDPFLEADNLRERAMGLIKEAAGLGINVRGVEALMKVGDEALNMATGFKDEGNSDAARSLSRVAVRIYEEAGDLAEHILDVASHTEIAKFRSLGEGEDANEIVIDNNGIEIEVREIGGDSRHVAKISTSIPRITYVVTDEEGREVEFSSIIKSLVEFEDRDNDGRIQDEEILQILGLDDITWTVSQEEEFIGEGSKVIKVTYSAESLNYAISIVLRVYESISIEFFRSDEKTVVYSVDGGAREVKFDLIITRWPWQSTDSQLAMRMDLEGEVDEGVVAIDEVSDDENRLVLSSQGVDLKVKWITKASLEQVDGLTSIVDVVTAHEIDEGELRVDFIYPNFGDSILIHDPSVGLIDPVPENEVDPEPLVQIEPQNPVDMLELPALPEVEVENFYQFANPLFLIPIGVGVIVLVLATLLLRRRAS